MMPARDPWQTRQKYGSFLRPPRVRLCVFVRCVRSHAAVTHEGKVQPTVTACMRTTFAIARRHSGSPSCPSLAVAALVARFR